MRTNIVIDHSLMQRAMKATGLSTKKAVVEEGLRLLIKVKGIMGSGLNIDLLDSAADSSCRVILK